MKIPKAEKCKKDDHDYFELKSWFYIDWSGYRVKAVKFQCDRCGKIITKKYW